jgi:predicted nucleic acid-binding protein
MIVVDTNIIAALYIENPHRDEVEALLATEPYWLAPLLWRSEFRNVLTRYVRHGTIALNASLRIMQYAEELVGEMDAPTSSPRILRLAHTSGCSAYDCEFVALAQDIGTVLITFDRKILTTFPNVAMNPSAFLASTV